MCMKKNKCAYSSGPTRGILKASCTACNGRSAEGVAHMSSGKGDASGKSAAFPPQDNEA